jgi:DNA-binding response OmpR family regulator
LRLWWLLPPICHHFGERRFVEAIESPPFNEVGTAPDGLATLDAIRARAPDVVLSDVMMPRLDGPGLVRELRSDPATSSLPVILLSVRAGAEATIEGLDAGRQ